MLTPPAPASAPSCSASAADGTSLGRKLLMASSSEGLAGYGVGGASAADKQLFVARWVPAVTASGMPAEAAAAPGSRLLNKARP